MKQSIILVLCLIAGISISDEIDEDIQTLKLEKPHLEVEIIMVQFPCTVTRKFGSIEYVDESEQKFVEAKEKQAVVAEYVYYLGSNSKLHIYCNDGELIQFNPATEDRTIAFWQKPLGDSENYLSVEKDEFREMVSKVLCNENYVICTGLDGSHCISNLKLAIDACWTEDNLKNSFGRQDYKSTSLSSEEIDEISNSFGRCINNVYQSKTGIDLERYRQCKNSNTKTNE